MEITRKPLARIARGFSSGTSSKQGPGAWNATVTSVKIPRHEIDRLFSQRTVGEKLRLRVLLTGESFRNAQARNRRHARLLSFLCRLTALLMGIPLAALIWPLLCAERHKHEWTQSIEHLLIDMLYLMIPWFGLCTTCCATSSIASPGPHREVLSKTLKSSAI
jgi:hypothetical protein